ncbi:MAG: helix-turn-helix domain-containing protein, partial [Candidatus Promineifilaceae bacterium]
MSAERVNIVFGMKLRQARQAAGLSLVELAAAAGLSPSYLTEIEKGRKHPRAAKIMAIAQALGVPYDALVSIRLAPSLAYLENALDSPLLREFPFAEFGLDPAQVIELLTQAPDQASALLHAILEIGQQYDLKEEHFLRAMLRSYQELHANYFPEIEAAAEAFAQEHGLAAERPLNLAQLRALVRERFGYTLDDETLAAEPTLSGYRSVMAPGRRPRLYLNSRLLPRQLSFLLLREMGYQALGLQERSYTSTPDRVDSFQQVLNDFKASYFGGALLMPRPALLPGIEGLFSQERWRPGLLPALLAAFGVTPEMLLYRFSELIPEFFGLQLHFLRLQAGRQGYQVVKRLNMNRLPIPAGLAASEHFCRRWLSTRLLTAAGDQADWERPLVGVQFSRFVGDGPRFLCLGFARPLRLSPGVISSVVVGFREDRRLAEVVR